MSIVRGHVYFASPVEGGPIKIGCSKMPKNRIKALIALVPYELEILACAPGNQWDETRLHNIFIDSHLRSEWFKPSFALWSMIESVRQSGELPAEAKGDVKTRSLLRAKISSTIRQSPEWRAKVSARHKAWWVEEKARREVTRRISACGIPISTLNARIGAELIHVRKDGSFYTHSADAAKIAAALDFAEQKAAA